jgi:hypothetical protein
MCFVRGDPRTADYTVRFLAQPSALSSANDNHHDLRREARSLSVQTRPLGRAATLVVAAIAISGSLWFALNLVSMIAEVFG